MSHVYLYLTAFILYQVKQNNTYLYDDVEQFLAAERLFLAEFLAERLFRGAVTVLLQLTGILRKRKHSTSTFISKNTIFILDMLFTHYARWILIGTFADWIEK